jgi:hypothetical protein
MLRTIQLSVRLSSDVARVSSAQSDWIIRCAASAFCLDSTRGVKRRPNPPAVDEHQQTLIILALAMVSWRYSLKIRYKMDPLPRPFLLTLVSLIHRPLQTG